MATTFLPPDQGAVDDVSPRQISITRSFTDQFVRGTLRSSGIAVLVIMTLVGLFLGARALEALRVAGPSFITTQVWEPDGGQFGIAAVLSGTVFIAVTSILIVVPLSTAVALYISEYAPRRIKRSLSSISWPRCPASCSGCGDSSSSRAT